MKFKLINNNGNYWKIDDYFYYSRDNYKNIFIYKLNIFEYFNIRYNEI